MPRKVSRIWIVWTRFILVYGMNVDLELTSLECLAKLPISGCGVVASEGPSIAGGDLEGEALAVEVVVVLPVLAPVSRHGLPPWLWSLDWHGVDVPGAADVADQYQVEVRVTIDCEPYSSFLHTGHPVKTSKQLCQSNCKLGNKIDREKCSE